MHEYPAQKQTQKTRPAATFLLILACLAVAWSFAIASLFGIARGNSNRFEIVSAIAILLAAGLIVVAFFKVSGKLSYVAEPSESNQLYRALTELSDQIIWMADKDGKVTYFNQQWYDYTGFRPEDTVDDGWAEALHLDHRESALSVWQHSVQTGTPYKNEYLIRRLDGVYRWHIGRGLPLRDERGRTINWFGICIDIHDQRIAAAATARIAERLVMAMEAGETGTYEVYPDTGEAIWSDQCRAILGVPRDCEAGIESMMRVVHPDDRDSLKQIMQAIRSGEPPKQIEIEFRVFRPDGELHWISTKGRSSQDVHIARGKRFTGVVTDITIRKQAEQERLAFTAHIEAAREMERTHVAREIHDELGQILTAIKLDVAWINSRIRGLEGVGDLSERANAALTLLDQSVQTVKRIAAELRPSVLDSLGLCEAVEWLARNFGTHTGVAPSLHIQIDDAELPKDCQTALFRVTQEGLTNIARHAEATEVAVFLTRHDGSIRLVICDNGCGFSTDLKKAGSFGLIGMRERISIMGGQFNIRSDDGQGTIITATLPIPGAKLDYEHPYR